MSNNTEQIKQIEILIVKCKHIKSSCKNIKIRINEYPQLINSPILSNIKSLCISTSSFIDDVLLTK